MYLISLTTKASNLLHRLVADGKLKHSIHVCSSTCKIPEATQNDGSPRSTRSAVEDELKQLYAYICHRICVDSLVCASTTTFTNTAATIASLQKSSALPLKSPLPWPFPSWLSKGLPTGYTDGESGFLLLVCESFIRSPAVTPFPLPVAD